MGYKTQITEIVWLVQKNDFNVQFNAYEPNIQPYIVWRHHSFRFQHLGLVLKTQWKVWIKDKFCGETHIIGYLLRAKWYILNFSLSWFWGVS